MLHTPVIELTKHVCGEGDEYDDVMPRHIYFNVQHIYINVCHLFVMFMNYSQYFHN